MATRRPNMPRVRPAGNEPERAAEGATDSAPAAVNRSKVIPLGAAPGHDDGASQVPSRTSGAGRPGTRKPATRKPSGGTAGTGKGTSGKPAGKPAAGKPAAAKPSSTGPGKRPSGPREKRLRERAELSGAIRSGGKSGPRGPAQPQRPAADAAPVPARAFSGRMLALAVILAVVTVLLLPSVGTYMNQRSEIARLESSIAQKQQEQDNLKTQIARWDDPAYVKAQARNRINLVMPGEKKYMVIGATGDESAVGPESVGNVRTDLPWVDSLWDTVVRSATD